MVVMYSIPCQNPKILHFDRLPFWVHTVEHRFNNILMWVYLFYKHLTLQGYFFLKKSGFCQFLFNTSYKTKLPPPPPPWGICAGFRAFKFVTRTYSRGYNFVTPLYTPEREKKICLKQLLFVVMNLDATSWFYTEISFDSLWVNFVKWLRLTFQNLISSQNQQHVQLKNCHIKKYFVHKNIWRINYFITSMFLQKLHTDWNPNRASKKNFR
jgi:hypothetical protein